jgi:hypothetical protein
MRPSMRLRLLGGLTAVALSGCAIHNQPAPAPSAPPVDIPACPPPAPQVACGTATALCNDGTYSCAQSHQGACSHHGGVQCFW